MDSTSTQALFVGAVATTLLVLYVSMVLFKRRVVRKSLRAKVPPGPTPWPVIGSLHLLGAGPHLGMAGLAQKYGPVMSLQMGQRRCIVASSREAAKEFLKLQDANFSSRPPFRCGQILFPQDLVFNDLTPDLRHMRKILVSELMAPKQLEASRYVRMEEIAYMLRTISKEGVKAAPVQMKTHLGIMANNILTRMVLSKRFLGGDGYTAKESEILEFLSILEEEVICLSAFHLQDFFNVPKWFDPQGWDTRMRKLRSRMDAFYTNMINQHKEERRNNPISDEAQKGILDILLEQLDSPEHVITEDHVKSLLMDILSAGTETTVLTTEWAMSEVLRSPHIMKQARSELDHVVGLNRTVQESDIPELHYIRAIVKESFRLHPPLPLLVPHMNRSPSKVFGYDIPAEVSVFVNVWAIGRDSQIWEKPLDFLPERFLNGASHRETDVQGQHFELTPFGSGRRICPGMAFGLLTVHMQVANLLHAFDWSLPGGVAPENLDMTDAPPGFTLPKRDPLVAIAKPRLPANLY